jgi:hypothetical protein
MTIFIRKEIKKISMFETIIYEDGGVHWLIHKYHGMKNIDQLQ